MAVQKTLFNAREYTATTYHEQTYNQLGISRLAVNILLGLCKYRLLTTTQAYALIYGRGECSQSRQVKCRSALATLESKRLIEKSRLNGSVGKGRPPNYYYLSKAGAEFLKGFGVGDALRRRWKPVLSGDDSPYHLSCINTFRVALDQDIQKMDGRMGLEVEARELRSLAMRDYIEVTEYGVTRKHAFVSDHFFVAHYDTSVLSCFLEADTGFVNLERSDPTQDSWHRKILCSLAYMQSDTFKQRYKLNSFRVCVTTTTQRRIEHIKELTQQLGGKSRFWFTTHADIQQHGVLFNKIWDIADREGKHAIIGEKRKLRLRK